MNNAFVALPHKLWSTGLYLLGLLCVLSACGDSIPAKPAAWENYQGANFTMNYSSDWNVATKDLYLGTRYPQMEMLQGISFTSQANPSTYVQVVYAENGSGQASVSDLLRKFILGSIQEPIAASQLAAITLAGERGSQGSVVKQANNSTGASSSVKETAVGLNHAFAHKTEIYLIIYQDAASSYSKTQHDFFTRMVNSFHFVG